MQNNVNIQRLLIKRGLCDQPNARRRLVQQLAKCGIRADVLQAMGTIPRHAFAPPQLTTQAYANRLLCVGQTVLSDPCCVVAMTQHLDLNCRKRVLEIGTGTGYHTAIVALLSGCVFTIERISSLVEESKEAFAALGLCNISQKLGDGHAGWPEAAPFDAILVTAGGPTIPQTLIQQLHPQGGRMVIPVGTQGGCQQLYLVQRRGGRIHQTDLGPTYFIPFIPGPTARTGAQTPPAFCQPRGQHQVGVARC